jgi:hypothetical protein
MTYPELRRRRGAHFAIVISLLCGLTPGVALAQSTADTEQSSQYSFTERRPSGWKGAFIDSARLLLIQHTTRIIFQPKTRRELGGPFLPDYRRSVKRPNTWTDGDGWLVNYVGHPIQGAAAGYLWVNNASNEPSIGNGLSREYWLSRGQATAFSALYSLQFELGPLSEASIGNVGMRSNTIGWTDYIVTPLGGLAFMVAEDLTDHHVLKPLERRIQSPTLRHILRVALTPSRAFANMGQGHMPWYRPERSR